MIDHNPTRTRLFRELQRLWLPRTFVLHADVRQLAKITRAFAILVLDGPDEHAEARLKGRDLGSLGGVEECIGHVVDHLSGQ
jgi:hypothetical protein